MIENNKQNSKIISEKCSLAGLIDYHSDSVVSRVLMKKDNGSVTIFAFDEGEGLSEHTTPYEAMVYIIEGEAEIIISSKSHIVKTGEMIIMPANQPHALKAITKYKMMLVMIKS